MRINLDFVICPICRKKFQSLFPAHLKFHDVTLSEFQKRFPNRRFQSMKLARKRSNSATRINTGRKLSSVTRDNISKSVYMSNRKSCGDKHPRWKGGSTYDLKWRTIRNAIIERDKNVCRNCERTAKWLDVHHIDENPENNCFDNLITLCRSCHGKIHERRPTEEARKKAKHKISHRDERGRIMSREQVESADRVHSVSIRKGVSNVRVV